MINWKVRIKNKTFWITIVPAILLLVKQVLSAFGIEFDSTAISTVLEEIISTVFIILSLLGICVDPTTSGVSDSEQALTYDTPKE